MGFLTGLSFCDTSAASVAAVVKAVKLPPGVMHELHSHLRDSSLASDPLAPNWVAAGLSEALYSTGFRFQGGGGGGAAGRPHQFRLPTRGSRWSAFHSSLPIGP